MVQRNVIRKMSFADLSAVRAIEQQVIIGAWSEKLFADCIKVGYECWVQVEEEQVVGYGVMSYAANEAHLLNIAIDPAYQHQGYGQKLMQHFINTAKANNAEEMFLEVRVSNTPALNFYKKFKFVEIGLRKGYYPAEQDGTPAEDAITMTLAI